MANEFPPTPRIFLADLRDHAQVRAVIGLLDAYARDPMGLGRPLAPDVKRRLATGLRRHNAIVLLAQVNDEPVGAAICFLRYSTFAARPILNLHDLIVAPAHRRRGIGGALLQAAEKHARRLRCCRLTLEVRSDNLSARSIYREASIGPGEPPYEYWGKSL